MRICCDCSFLAKRAMSVFVQRFNVVTGLKEWSIQDENYDFHQEVARAAFADMLHDKSRNELYYAGVKAAIQTKHLAGEKAHVLDIGTGTGLLAMMAARSGADSVFACEAFPPMTECAKKIIKLNGLEDRVTVIDKRSTDVKVGQDLPQKANILVTEVFDTELIGEGALGTFNHAHQHLLEADCLVVPSTATVYAQLVEGPLFSQWNRLQPFKDETGTTLLKVPPNMAQCPGPSVVHDLQLSSLHEFTALSEPFAVFEFDWSTPNIPVKRNMPVKVTPAKNGKCCAVFMWWELFMDPERQILLSCAPKWRGNDAWRDHWIQAVYYLPSEVTVHQDKELTLHACHDEYSMWFYESSAQQTRLPNCTCHLHLTTSFTRIGNVNDPDRRLKFLKVLKSKVKDNTRAFVIGDGTLIPSLIKKLGALEVTTNDQSIWSKELAKFNQLNINYTEDMDDNVTMICSDVNFGDAILPWDHLKFWYLRSKFGDVKDIVPFSASLLALPVELEDLWKIRAPLGEVEGFKMKPFDDLIETSSNISDCVIEPQPMWEYVNRSLGAPVKLLHFDFTQSVHKVNSEGNIPLLSEGKCNAIILWMDWHLDESTTISSGPTFNPEPGTIVTWDKHTRQALYLTHLYEKASKIININFNVLFLPDSGSMDIKFNIL